MIQELMGTLSMQKSKEMEREPKPGLPVLDNGADSQLQLVKEKLRKPIEQQKPLKLSLKQEPHQGYTSLNLLMLHLLNSSCWIR